MVENQTGAFVVVVVGLLTIRRTPVAAKKWTPFGNTH
jgi:hypothetical protein